MKCSDCGRYKTKACHANPSGKDFESAEQFSCFFSRQPEIDMRILDVMIQLPDVMKRSIRTDLHELEHNFLMDCYLQGATYVLLKLGHTRHVEALKSILRKILQQDYDEFWRQAREKIEIEVASNDSNGIPMSKTRVRNVPQILKTKIAGVGIGWWLLPIAFFILLYLLYQNILKYW